jgi:hypothetical protein
MEDQYQEDINGTLIWNPPPRIMKQFCGKAVLKMVMPMDPEN